MLQNYSSILTLCFSKVASSAATLVSLQYCDEGNRNAICSTGVEQLWCSLSELVYITDIKLNLS